MLDDSRPRCFTICVVDCSIALETGLIENLIFKADRAVLQCAQPISRRRWGRCRQPCRQCIQLNLVFQIVSIQAHLDTIQQVGNHLGVATNRNALIQRIEIVVVKGQAHGQALDDESREILAVTPPLLLGVTLDELLIDVTTHERDSLLLQIFRLTSDFLALLLNFCSGFLRCHNAPHLVEGIHIKRQRIQFTLIISDRRICKSVELGKLGDVVPDFFIVGMEDMRTVLMDIDTLNILCVNIASNVGTLIYNQNRFSMRFSFMCKNGTIQAGANYQIIVHHNFPFPSLAFFN